MSSRCGSSTRNTYATFSRASPRRACLTGRMTSGCCNGRRRTLEQRRMVLRSLTKAIDITTSGGRLAFPICVLLAAFERL